jgi:aromatic-L-amino-acid decarboxylase
VEAEPGWEICAPVPFSTVCFRVAPRLPLEGQNAYNERLLNAANADGSFFISHTKLGAKLVLRLCVGNLRTSEEHLAKVWEVLREKDSIERAGVM